MYVRKFSGLAMSHADWKYQYNQLMLDLMKDGADVKRSGEFFHTSYNSPFVEEIRQNEIWVEAEA